MRLLLLTHRRADPSFRLRWERFLPEFAAAGWTVDITEVRRRGRAAALAAAERFDTTVLHRRLLRAHDFAMLRRAARRLVYDFDDALCFRAEPPFRSPARERRFFRAVEGADDVFAGSRILAGLARLRARRVFVVPTTAALLEGAGEPDGFPVVWIGQRATLPHLEVAREAIVRAGASVPGFRLRVVADAAPPGAEFVPWSVAAEEEALRTAAVGVMPLPEDPFARGKCGYKLLRYHAAGLPAIASPVGVNRALAEGGALPARTPEEWENALRRLAAEPALRARLGARGRAFVRRRYAPAILAPRLLRLLHG